MPPWRDHQPVPVRERSLRDIRLLGFVLSKASVIDLATAARMINTRLAQGGLRPRHRWVLLLDDTVRAHRYIEERCVRGRVLIVPNQFLVVDEAVKLPV